MSTEASFTALSCGCRWIWAEELGFRHSHCLPGPSREGNAIQQVTKLKHDLDSKLNFAGGRGSSRQQTRHACPSSRRIENVSVIGRCGRSEVGVVENVENLSPELHVEGFRDSLYAGFFDHREVQGCYAGTDQDI